VGSETWKKCKIGLFRFEEIQWLQNNKSAATQLPFKDFGDDNIGHSVAYYQLFYGSQHC